MALFRTFPTRAQSSHIADGQVGDIDDNLANGQW